ncbi:hypothetical protein M422DRAFT_778005 [Sphaerobolus stellatus SS14]|uniref:Uncharacterized protein n=1 Tax=Sphaerobolus stellatus (strain SS14) TaxID=990650 RepID=A0A0C9VIS5_SPHS4|nr:hypothetical protein M422DRAFT_778005 [Sphaerobolus stellatus SS14]
MSSKQTERWIQKYLTTIACPTDGMSCPDAGRGPPRLERFDAFVCSVEKSYIHSCSPSPPFRLEHRIRIHLPRLLLFPSFSSTSVNIIVVMAAARPPRTPFEMTTLSLPMDRFVQNNLSEELEGFDIPLVDPANPHGYSLDKKGGDDDAAGEWEDDWRNMSESEVARHLPSVVQRILRVWRLAWGRIS